MKIQQIPFLFQKKGVREGKVQAGWVRWGGGGGGGGRDRREEEERER